MLAARALCDLLFGLRGDQLSHRACERQRQRERQRSRPRQRREHPAYRVFHDARRHAFVGDSKLLRATRIDCLAGQHEIERCRRTRDPRQSLHAAPPGDDTQHHFGQTEPRARLVDDDAVTARERQLEAAAEAEAAHERQGRILDGGETLERVPAALDDGNSVGLVLDLAELIDVRTGDETVRFSGGDDEPLGWIAIELVERLVELRQHFARQRVRGRSGLVEGEAREAVGVAG